jgi:hypothetical protein
MSVTSELYRVQVTLTGPADAVPIGFYFLEDADIIGFSTIDGVDSLLVLNTHYTLAGAGAEAGGMAAMIGGVAGQVITFARADALTQEEEFIYMGQLTPSSITRGYDRLCMQVQRLFSMAKRSIRLPITAAEVAEVGDVSTRKGKTMQFNATTGALELVDSADSSATAAAASAAAALASEEAAAASAILAASFTSVAFTALTGGGANALDGLITAGGAIPTNSVRESLTGSVGGGDLAISRWVLVAGTNAEDGISYVRPDDYNGATNARVWVRVG